MLAWRVFFSCVLTALLVGCSYTPKSNTTVPDSAVGATGDVAFSHEQLSQTKHLVIITAAPGLMETEGSIAQRIHIFANRFAAQTCPDAFEFVHDPNFSQPTAGGFMKRTRTYVFVCRG